MELQMYNNTKLIESRDNSFEVINYSHYKSIVNEEQIQQKQFDKQRDNEYEEYLRKRSENKNKEKEKFCYSKHRFEGKVEKMIEPRPQEDVKEQDILDKYKQSDDEKKEYRRDIEGFIVKQLIKIGYKKISNLLIKGNDGYSYNINQFIQKDDGYIYGPKVKIIKNDFGIKQEQIQEEKITVGIFKQNKEGILFGPDGQQFGHVDKVVPMKRYYPQQQTQQKDQQEQTSILKTQFDQVSKDQVKSQLNNAIQFLQAGVVFIKYGQNNIFNGDKRKLFIDNTLRFICWTDQLDTKNIVSIPKNNNTNHNQIINENYNVSHDKQQEQQNQSQSKDEVLQIDHHKQSEETINKSFNLKQNNNEMIDDSQLQKSTIFLDHDGHLKETQQQHIIYELRNDQQKKINKLFEINNIQTVLNGRKTKNFKRFQTKDQSRIDNSFSLVFKDRSIDLEALNKDDKDKFISSLIYLIQNIDFTKPIVSTTPFKLSQQINKS